MTWDRLQGIGASEVPIIMGQTPWGSEVGVWMEKVDLGPHRRETGAMVAGRVLEGVVLDLGARTRDVRIVRNHVTFPHPDWPTVPLYATPDGFTRRRWAVVEAKVVGHRYADWADGPPQYVQTQVQAQLACYPRAVSGLVVALLGTDVRVFDLPRDPEAIAALEVDMASWWRSYVQPEIAPPVESPDDRWAMARVLAGRTPARQVRVATGEEEVLGARLSALLGQADDIATEVAEVRLALAEAATDSDVAGGGWRASWATRRTTDWKAVARDWAAPSRLVEEHSETSQVFTFRRSKTLEETA